jgi:hypothetical protein
MRGKGLSQPFFEKKNVDEKETFFPPVLSSSKKGLF